jgi:uridine kinase
MGRYETTILQNEIARLINLKTPTTVELGYYDKVKRQVSANAKKVSIKPGEVIIIEGVIALNLALNPAPRTMHTWYVELNEENRQKRVLQEYLLRGESLEKAQQHYTERLQDEAPIIKATRSSAQHCIDLGFPEK